MVTWRFIGAGASHLHGRRFPHKSHRSPPEGLGGGGEEASSGEAGAEGDRVGGRGNDDRLRSRVAIREAIAIPAPGGPHGGGDLGGGGGAAGGVAAIGPVSAGGVEASQASASRSTMET